MAKNLLNKYVWLVELSTRQSVSPSEEITEKWLGNDMSVGLDLALRTFHKWRIARRDVWLSG